MYGNVHANKIYVDCKNIREDQSSRQTGKEDKATQA